MMRHLWNLIGFRGLSVSTIALLVVTPYALYNTGMIRKDKLKKSMFNTGFIISQKFKKIPFWDKYVEPAFVKNFATLVIAGNALLEGMVSDNELSDEKTNNIINDMQKMRDDIKEDLAEFDKIDHDENIKKGDQQYITITNKLSNKIETFLNLDNKAYNRVLKIVQKSNSKKSENKDKN